MTAVKVTSTTQTDWYIAVA